MKKLLLVLSSLLFFGIYSCVKENKKECIKCTVTNDGYETSLTMCEGDQYFRDLQSYWRDSLGIEITWSQYKDTVKLRDPILTNVTCDVP